MKQFAPQKYDYVYDISKELFEHNFNEISSNSAELQFVMKMTETEVCAKTYFPRSECFHFIFYYIFN